MASDVPERIPDANLTPPLSVVDPSELVGKVIGDRYRIDRVVGEGGLGVVFEAEHLTAGRRVALKILRPEYAHEADLIETFLEEARTVSRLGHENIIDIYYGARSSDGFTYLTMEYLEGHDLAPLLNGGDVLPWARWRSLLLQIVDALAAVHASGFVHGDIKPGNIFVTQGPEGGERVKVLDFGIARVAAGVSVARGGNPNLAGMGTPQYLAPEQALRLPVDARTDVYSLGCLMYHAATGSLPFEAEDVVELMEKQAYELPQPPRQRRPDLPLPAAVEAVILRAMEKDPANRWQDMATMREAILRCRLGTRSVPEIVLDGLPTDDAEQTSRLRRRRRQRRALIVALVAAIATTAILLAAR